MDARLLKRWRRFAKKAIKLVPCSDGVCIIFGRFEWHWSDYSLCKYSWKRSDDVFISTTFKDKEEIKKQYNNAIRDAIEICAMRERKKREAKKIIEKIKSEE